MAALAACGCAGGPQQAAKQPSVPPPSLTSLFQPLTGKNPSTEGNWIPELKVLAHANFEQEKVTIQNVRNCEFLTYHDCLVDYYDRTFDLTQIQSVDFIVVPFSENKAIAHTMLSFGFANGEHVGISVEVRLEQGEKYDATRGLLGEYELVYVIADERELILSRTEHRNCDVYLYRTTASPEMARKLFTDMLKRANQLQDNPEFYDTLSNNCTTNIVEHINKLVPGRVPYDLRVILPGYADELGYELGLLDNSVPFAELKKRSRINEVAHRFKDEKGPVFSAKIRGEKMPKD